MSEEKVFPHVNFRFSELDYEKCDVYSLGTVLYKIMMDKYPFNVQSLKR
jgi:hypothetical protein